MMVEVVATVVAAAADFYYLLSSRLPLLDEGQVYLRDPLHLLLPTLPRPCMDLAVHLTHGMENHLEKRQGKS